MDGHQATCQFVSKKIRQIRWQISSKLSANAPELFCTGSWDDGPNNEIAIWRIDSLEDDECKLIKHSTFPSSADVEDLQFLTENKILFSSSRGDLFLLQSSLMKDQLDHLATWRDLHNGACTSFSVLGEEIVTAGEDGRLKVLNLQNANLVDVTGDVSSAPFYCVKHYGFQEVVAGNAVGQLQLWDLKQKHSTNLINTLIPSGTSCGSVTSLCCHPSQKHVTVVGYQSGAVVFWDLRRSDVPAASLTVHNGPVWDVKFHEFYPTNFFTASNDGSLIHWDASSVQQIANISSSSWFSGESLQNKMKLVNILPENVFPVNSLDVFGESLLTCTDNEAIWLLRNLKIS